MNMMVTAAVNAWYVSPSQGVSFIAALNCAFPLDLPAETQQNHAAATEPVEAWLHEHVLQPLTQTPGLDDAARRPVLLQAALDGIESTLPEGTSLYLISCEPAAPCVGGPEDDTPGWLLACGIADVMLIRPVQPTDLPPMNPAHPFILGSVGSGKGSSFYSMMEQYRNAQPAIGDAPDASGETASKKPGLLRRLIEKIRYAIAELRADSAPQMHDANYDWRRSFSGYHPAMTRREDAQPHRRPGKVTYIPSSHLHTDDIRSIRSNTREMANAPDWRKDTLPSPELAEMQQTAPVPILPVENARYPGPVEEVPAPAALQSWLENNETSPFNDEADNAELSRLYAEEMVHENEPVKGAAPAAQAPAWRSSSIAAYRGPGDTMPSLLADTADLPPVSDEPLCMTQVQFTAAAPRAVQPGESFLLDVMMYSPEFRQMAHEMISQSIGDAATHESGFHDVALHQAIRVMLQSEDIGFRETSGEVIWNGKLSQFSFMPTVPKSYSKTQIRMTATVFVDGIGVRDLPLIVRLSHQPQQIPVEHSKPRSIFISYAQRDTFEVHKRLQGMYAIAPDLDVFIDWMRLKTGVRWRERIMKEILRCDQFFLFWSRNARRSNAVNDEWRFALKHKGLSAIVPMPLELPSACPPPDELNDLHFCDWTIAYGTAHRLAFSRPRWFGRW